MASLATLLSLMPGDVVGNIGSYLPIQDYVNLMKMLNVANPDYVKMKQFWIERGAMILKNKLEDMGWTQELFDCLKKSGAVIAGSFPLQCLLKEFWEESDVDIFAPYNGNFTYKQTEILNELLDMNPKRCELLMLHGYDKRCKKYCTQCNYVDNATGRCGHIVPFFDEVTGDEIIIPGCNAAKNLNLSEIDFDGYIGYLEDHNFSPASITLQILCIFRKKEIFKSKSDYVSKYREVVGILKRRFCDISGHLDQNKDTHYNIGKVRENIIFGDNSYGGIVGRFSIEDFLMGEVHHQIILFVDKTPLEVVNSFDYEFCKVYFDGETLHVKNWESILTRTTSIGGNTRPNRKPKYESRGFTILDSGDSNGDDSDGDAND